jgi:RNA polymerase sigma-70 factor (ECF subfamily)
VDATILARRSEAPLVSDELLVERTAAGDVRAFEELIERYQAPALRVAFRFVGDAQEAEDLAQEAFLRVYLNAARYNYAARFGTWFFQILMNLCRDWLKKRKPVLFGEPPGMAAAGADPSDAIELARRAQTVQRAIQNLPPNQRLALILCHYEEMSYREASLALQLSEKAIESLLVRARRTLRKRLADLHR